MKKIIASISTEFRKVEGRKEVECSEGVLISSSCTEESQETAKASGLTAISANMMD